jgi:hypothetical protein
MLNQALHFVRLTPKSHMNTSFIFTRCVRGHRLTYKSDIEGQDNRDRAVYLPCIRQREKHIALTYLGRYVRMSATDEHNRPAHTHTLPHLDLILHA